MHYLSLVFIFTSIGSNLVFSEMEYFIYLNMWLMLLLLLLFMTFLLINSSSVFITSINFTNSLIELIITLFCILYLLFIISPALMLLLDSDILMVPSFIIYTIGYQWAWSLNIYFNGTLSTYVDHCLVSSSLMKWIKPMMMQTNNSSMIIPLYSLVSLLIMSYDVIHSVGFYSVGIKMDATPAKINLSQSMSTLKKGQYSGFCFELCGYGHTSMLLTSNIIDILMILVVQLNKVNLMGMI